MAHNDGGPEQTGTRVQGADGGPDPFDPEDSGPYPVHGVAIPADGLTFGKDEEWTFWPEQVARDTEGRLRGRNLIDLHPDEPTNDDVIGEVTGELFIDGLGLAWTGEVDSRARAKQAYRGRLDSSPYLYAIDGGDRTKLPDEAPDETRVASEVTRVRDIGFVPDGAIQGSEVQAGPHPDMGGGEQVQAALSRGFGETDKSGHGEPGGMSNDGDGSDGDTVEDLKAEIEDLRTANETLQNEVETLRRPYLEAVTAGTDLTPESVNMDAKDLAEYFAGGEDGDGEGNDEPAASVEGGNGGGNGGEQATALSSAPLTAARGSPPGEGEVHALESGQGSGGNGGGGTETVEVEVPDEDLEVLEERRRLASGRTTDEHTEKLDRQIQAKRQAEGL